MIKVEEKWRGTTLERVEQLITPTHYLPRNLLSTFVRGMTLDERENLEGAMGCGGC